MLDSTHPATRAEVETPVGDAGGFTALDGVTGAADGPAAITLYTLFGSAALFTFPWRLDAQLDGGVARSNGSVFDR